MKEYYFFFVLLSLSKLICSSLSNISIQHVCEYEKLFLKCSNNNETIQIIRSMYGRTSQRICNQNLTNQLFYKTCANIEQSKNETKNRCQGKTTCQFIIDNQIYTDPCGSMIPKHFEVHYRCINLNELFNKCFQTQDLKCIKQIQYDYSSACPISICQYNKQNQLIGFQQRICSQEYFQGIHWPQTLANKGQHMSCPSPCTGQIVRFCQQNSQWSTANYTDCQCPSTTNSIARHIHAHDYIFQCNFWLINRLLPEGNSCIFETDDNSSSTTCLISAFEKMSTQFCQSSFRIDFKNIQFEIYIPKSNENLIHLSMNNIHFTQTISSPLMIINENQKSFLLIQQSNKSYVRQTATNLTVIFNHQSEEIRYQCRAYRSIDDMFFVCQTLCSNQTHTICQCPFYSPYMRYVLHLDISISKDEYEISQIDTCSSSNDKIDYYLNKFNRFTQKKILAKKLITFIDRHLNEDNIHRIHQLEYLSLQFIDKPIPFNIITDHIEFFIHPTELENTDESVRISLSKQTNLTTFFVVSNVSESIPLNSHIVNFYPNENLQIIFRHLVKLNNSNQISICIHLENDQWSTDQCSLIDSNATHSICSCQHVSTIALLIQSRKITIDYSSLISKILCTLSVVCLILFIISLIIKRKLSVDDDLILVRNFLQINLFICLLINQILCYFNSKDQLISRLISLFQHYFLLSSFSWMFVDEIELILIYKHLFKFDRFRLIGYAFYAYGFPFLIVLLSIYGYFSYNNPYLWPFAIPFLLLIFTNCGFIICSFVNLKCTLLRIHSIISILFGCIWFLSLVYFQQQLLIRIIIYSCENLLLILVYCLLNSYQDYQTNTSVYNSSAQSSEITTNNKDYLNTIPNCIREHDEQLLKKYPIDDHQYYEIG